MTTSSRTRRLAAVLSTCGLVTLGITAATASATPHTAANGGSDLYGVARQFARQAAHPNLMPTGTSPADSGGGGGEEGGDDPLEVADQAEQYANERSAPGDDVSSRALLAARRAAAKLPAATASVSEVTDQPYNAEPDGYTDPYWSNLGSGFRDVSGRVTALAVDGHTFYSGMADGGVWKSTDAGWHWHSIWDHMPSLSIGALMVGPRHALWVGTGEANTNADSYLGTGVYRSTDGGKSFARVGGGQLADRQVYRLLWDHHGHVYAATSQGLYRHSVTTAAGKWLLVLKPDPNPTGSPYLTSMITDVAVRPGTHGRVVLAADGWRNGSSYNGFYLSTDGGGQGSFTEITPTGDIDASDIGRTTFAYAADGSRLYAIVESPSELLAGDDTNLQGVYVSASGNPRGPWTLIADSDKLDNSGSALADQDGYHVGIQSWYNQALAVDPNDPMHVYVSLEEVFQSTDGGQTFTTASPYWNYGLACGDTCPPTTHPDQHALAITQNGYVVIGNDGGVYKRAEHYTGYGHWKDLNDTLHTLQYYDAAAGRLNNGYAYWGGMQDNGTGVLNPGAAKQVEPAGGDGGMVYVNPKNGAQMVGEYTDLIMYKTTDGGHTYDTISPLCGYYTGANCDPSARFIAPFTADVHNGNHWVSAGHYVWETNKGFGTECSGTTCDWHRVHNFGADSAGGYNVGTALAVSGTVIYAGWVDSGGNPSPSFASGIDTNYGGTWHRIASPVLPNRYLAGLTVDPKNDAHVYAVYNGYSRRWIPGGGLGTVFESTDGGSTWHNITANLPDAPGDGLAIVNGRLALATDIGVFVANEKGRKVWQRVDGLPNAVANNIRPMPGKPNTAVVATHGRGIWTVHLK